MRVIEYAVRRDTVIGMSHCGFRWLGTFAEVAVSTSYATRHRISLSLF